MKVSFLLPITFKDINWKNINNIYLFKYILNTIKQINLNILLYEKYENIKKGNLTNVTISKKDYDIFGFFLYKLIKNGYYNNCISDIYNPKYFYKLNSSYLCNLYRIKQSDIKKKQIFFFDKLEKTQKVSNQYLNPKKKIVYIGFWSEHTLETDHIYLNIIKDNNYSVVKANIISDELLSKYDIIICGSFLHNPQDIFILSKYYDKVIYNVTEPIEFNNKFMYKIYSKNLINLTVGCVKENGTHIKYPHYMDWGLTLDKIIDANNMIKHITLEQVLNKKFCCLINRHDMGKTRTAIYNKLKLIGRIDCPGILFNNYSNKEFEENGRTNFQKEYLFSICPENFITKESGYVTEKLFMASIAGNIPIYYGDLDSIDKSLFNMNRVLLFDPTSEFSINQVYYKILELMINPTKLYDFYIQPIFNYTAIQTFALIIENFKLRINNFINGKSYNHSLLTNESYEIKRKEPCDKINGIDHIVWINLDRSTDRRANMEKILEKINIPNTRIKAVDGKNEDMEIYNYLQRPMTNYEKACVLSHIKAYSYLKNIPGNYFLVLEDDINLNNLKYFNFNLDKIIKESPTFDILMINKTHHNQIHQTYVKWKEDIYSTVAYVISKNGINKLINYVAYNESKNKFVINHPLSVADYFLYNALETWVYKYNFLCTEDESSIIHPEHLNTHKNSSLFQLIQIFNDLVFN